MSRPQLLGEIVEKDGYICLQTSPICWYPLGGSSYLAGKFCENFGEVQRSDIGRRVYRSGDVLQMENLEQMRERQAAQ